MSIMITSEVSKEYMREEDAVEGFKAAVENGQVRLALQILSDVIDGMMEIFNMAFDDSEENEEPKQEEAKQVPLEEPVAEVKETAVKKPAAKKEETKVEAE